MPIRPPRFGISVARRLSERARAGSTTPDPHITAPGGFAGMVDALRGLVEQLSETARAQSEATGGEATGGEASGEPGEAKTSVVFGYTLRMGSEGVSAEPFGNVPTRERPAQPSGRREKTAAPATRQPIVEVFEDGDAVVVVAELPGADPDAIRCRVEGATLLIEASGAQSYRKELTLPVPVQPDGFPRSFRNGILEVRLVKAVGA